MVSVTLPGADPATSQRWVLTAPKVKRTLLHESHVAPGVIIGADLMVPDVWASISTDGVTGAGQPVLRALLGSRALTDLGSLTTGGALSVDPDKAAPWLRVAIVDALDRWLQLPLDQSLVDAERGVARGQAARALPGGPARRAVLGEALGLARSGAGGVRRYLHVLTARRRAVPSGLFGALRRLTEGYADLLDEVQGPDQELTSVLNAWQALAAAAVEDGDMPTRRRWPTPRPDGDGTSMIDPRQVRSRVFALAADPQAGEVTMRATLVEGARAVVVRVPAFRRALDQPVVPRLLVRLVDTLTSDEKGQSVLTFSPPTRLGRRPYFEGVVSLRGPSSAKLRADVFDALSEVPAAAADSDERLREVRRATVFLSEWRRLVALAQLPTIEPTPARRLRQLAKRVGSSDSDADRPLFKGGPTPGDLHRLADAGDDELLTRARSTDRPDGLFRVVVGTGGLLVAELAAILS